MTYCLGIITRTGLIMAADSRTNAGIDNISTYRKLFDFSLPGDRALIMSTSGNLSLSQAVLQQMERDLNGHSDTHLHSLSTLYEVARYVGEKIRHLHEIDRTWLKQDGFEFHCNFLIGGQIRNGPVELYRTYSQGDCIHATHETPYLQIGETKYGKPILDRVMTYDMSLDIAAKSAVLSLDSAMRSNLSVGPPLQLARYERDSLEVPEQMEFPAGHEYLIKMRREWESAMLGGLQHQPAVPWPESATVCAIDSLTSPLD
jgi:putative proteasome-type protease